MTKKLGVWIILILTSIALIIPSVGILYNLLSHDTSVNTMPVTINSDDIQVSVETSSPSASQEDEIMENEVIPENVPAPVINSAVSNLPVPAPTTIITSTGEIIK